MKKARQVKEAMDAERKKRADERAQVVKKFVKRNRDG
jgi:hypothetical protein